MRIFGKCTRRSPGAFLLLNPRDMLVVIQTPAPAFVIAAMLLLMQASCRCAWAADLEIVAMREGTFYMGCPTNPPSPWQFESQIPQHRVRISPFSISKYPVTVSHYCAFLKSVGFTRKLVSQGWSRDIVRLRDGEIRPRNKGELFAVSCATWEGAKEFCEWLSQESGKKCRLPSEAEWEFAARGVSGRTYPWGEEVISRNPWKDPIGKNPRLATPGGVHDLVGPVYQWCADEFKRSFYFESPVDNPLCTFGDGRHAVRGGPARRYGTSEALRLPPAWERCALGYPESFTRIGFRFVVEGANENGLLHIPKK